MSATDWWGESAKGLVDILSKGAFNGGIVGGISGIVGAGVYGQLPATSYRCLVAGVPLVREPAIGGGPPGGMLCRKIVSTPLGEWSSTAEAALMLGVTALIVVFVVSAVVMLYQAYLRGRAAPGG